MSKDASDVIIRCHLCSKTPTEPRMLPCNHTFCTRCLGSHIKQTKHGNHFSCELCKAVISIPKTEEKGFREMQYLLANQSGGKSKGSQKGFQRNSTRCDMHRKEYVKHLCRDCSETLCDVCLGQSHGHHDTVLLENVAAECREQLNIAVDAAKVKANRFEDEKSNIAQFIEHIDTKAANSIGEIESQVSLIKDKLDEYAAELINKLTSARDSEVDKLKHIAGEVSQKHLCLDNLLGTVTGIVRTAPDTDVTTMANQLIKSLDETDAAQTFHRDFWFFTSFTYSAGNFDMEGLKNTVGQVEESDVKPEARQSLSDVKTVKVFKGSAHVTTTRAIAALPDAKAWVCHEFNDAIQKIGVNGKTFETKKLKFGIDDLITCPGGMVLCTKYNGNSIMRVDGDPVEFASTDSFMRGLHVSFDGRTVLACGNDCNVQASMKVKVKKNSTVFVFTMKGSMIKEIHVAIDTGLCRICQTSRGDIIVTDILGKCYILGRDGVSTKEITAAKNTAGLCRDVDGHLVVADRRGDKLLLLDHEGRLLRRIATVDDGLFRPEAISLDNQGRIWVVNLDHISLVTYLH